MQEINKVFEAANKQAFSELDVALRRINSLISHLFIIRHLLSKNEYEILKSKCEEISLLVTTARNRYEG